MSLGPRTYAGAVVLLVLCLHIGVLSRTFFPPDDKGPMLPAELAMVPPEAFA